MTRRSIVVIGLPGSGKTTFLAALWHLIFSREIATQLGFGGLMQGDKKHLNEISTRWRNAQMQERTQIAGDRLVSLNFRSPSGDVTTVTFPDVAGEAYRQMWEVRECERAVAETLTQGNVLLFIHADNIKSPQWIADNAAVLQMLGLPAERNGEPVDWHPRLAPTQVQLVGLLDLLTESPLDVGPRRLAVMLSAWDRAKGERLSPTEFVRVKLPLLAQYLETNSDQWDARVFGVSAQGGEYDDVQSDALPKQSAEELRSIDNPSARIELTDGASSVHDLTVPIAWLMQ